MLERVHQNAGTKFHRAGHIQHYVDLRRSANRVRIFRDHRGPVVDRGVKLNLGAGIYEVIQSGILINMPRTFGMPIIDGGHTHSWNTVRDLVGQTLPHESCANHSDPDGPPLTLPGLQCFINDNHRYLLGATVRYTELS